MAIGDPVAATDADGDTLTYSAVGEDASKFVLDAATGQLSTKAGLDHESRSSYTFQLTATAPDGYSDTIEVTVNVTDVDEAPDVGLKRILGRPGQPQRHDSVYENGTFAPFLFAPTDPEDDALQVFLSGDDAAYFSLNDTDLDPDLLARWGPYVQLEFAWPPDFEAPPTGTATMSTERPWRSPTARTGPQSRSGSGCSTSTNRPSCGVLPR